MDITERIAAAARLALDAAETELRAVLAAQNGGGRGELRQIKDALALLKELTSFTPPRTRRSDGGGGDCAAVRGIFSPCSRLSSGAPFGAAPPSRCLRGAPHPTHTTYNTTRDEHTCLNF